MRLSLVAHPTLHLHALSLYLSCHTTPVGRKHTGGEHKHSRDVVSGTTPGLKCCAARRPWLFQNKGSCIKDSFLGPGSRRGVQPYNPMTRSSSMLKYLNLRCIAECLELAIQLAHRDDGHITAGKVHIEGSRSARSQGRGRGGLLQLDV